MRPRRSSIAKHCCKADRRGRAGGWGKGLEGCHQSLSSEDGFGERRWGESLRRDAIAYRVVGWGGLAGIPEARSPPIL
jgi:hypothetical protein